MERGHKFAAGGPDFKENNEEMASKLKLLNNKT
jgi:hypothetical protein